MGDTVMRTLRGVWIAALFFVAAPVAFSQTPVITSLNPSNVAAGGAGFTLAVNGATFLSSAAVRVNGVNRATVFVNATQLQATILSSDIAGQGSLQINVFNPVVGVPGGGFTSNTAVLTVGNAAGIKPTLTSASPGLVAQGASQLRLTLIGTNFRPGARVVISPPIQSVASSTGAVQASDISVEGVTFVSANVLVAYANVGTNGATGLRAIDVLNSDGTSTAAGGGVPGTSQPLRVSLSNSLGAPLAVATISVTSPRPGTVVAQGDDLYGEAVLAGSGSGTVIGEWLWDGNVTEQFAKSFAGGQSVTVLSQRSFPTSFLGVHTLELRITQPNRLDIKPISVVVNPGTWKIEKLLAPAYGARVASNDPPELLWAPVPGAAKYQVGFSSRPYFSAVQEWHDVADNRWTVPPDVWSKFSDGELYWTVCVIEISGAARKPLPMRLILRVPENALGAAAQRPNITPQGNPLLEWYGLSGKYLYRITVSLDPEGTQVVRRYLTAEPKLDLHALKGKLDAGRIYYWRVDAVTSDGRTILTGTLQSFVPPAAPSSSSGISPAAARMILTSLRTRGEYRAPAAPPPDIATLSNRTPAPDSTAGDAKLPVTLQFTAAPNPFDLAIQVDDIDVTSLADLQDTKVTYTPAAPLAEGAHKITVALGSDSTSWSFTVKLGTGVAAPAATDGETPPAAKKARKDTSSAPLQMDTQIASNTQWVSGSSPDSNGVTFGETMVYKNGDWNVQMNGSGLLNTVISPEQFRVSLGQVSNYVMQTGLQRGAWGMNIRFGSLAPALYANSQFVTTAAPRQGVETVVNSPAGSFGFYANTDDNLLGGGSGIAFHQQIAGASWDAPLPKKYVEFRMMWLYARDTGSATEESLDSQGNPITIVNPVETVGGGNAYGGLLTIHLSPRWLWTSEYSWSYNSADLTSGAAHLFGHAWRSGVTGQIKAASLNVSYLDVGPNFAMPTNPGLTSYSNPDRRGVVATLALPTKVGTFVLGDQSLASNYNQTNFPEQWMNAVTEGWSRNLNATTVLSVSSHQTYTTTGTVPQAVQSLPSDQQISLEADQRDLGANASVTRQVGKISLTLGGARDWFRNNLFRDADNITSSLLAGANWNYAQFFQLNANLSFNWIDGNKDEVGATHNVSGFLQPSFIWQRYKIQVQPIASYNQTRTALGSGILINNLNTGQYGGRVMWTMPGDFKFSTLSFEGDYTFTRNPLANQEFRATTALLVWTLNWDHRQGI